MVLPFLNKSIKTISWSCQWTLVFFFALDSVHQLQSTWLTFDLRPEEIDGTIILVLHYNSKMNMTRIKTLYMKTTDAFKMALSLRLWPIIVPVKKDGNTFGPWDNKSLFTVISLFS